MQYLIIKFFFNQLIHYYSFQLIESVCNQLFDFYRSPEIQLQRFSLQFLPTLIYIYLNAAAHGDIKVFIH
jgi:hypothetical protein